MTKEFWINLPVKDVNRSKEFFTKLGFSFNTKYGNTDVSAGLIVGDKKVVVMLFTEQVFKNFTGNELPARGSTEVLMSIDAATREEVDELAAKAGEAGGVVFGKPAESQGWLYGCAFSDLDGHCWNVLYRDMSKMPK